MTRGEVSGLSRNEKGEIAMGKTIKHISAPPDDPMFTGVTIISAIQRPILSSELESKKPVKKDKAKRSKKKR